MRFENRLHSDTLEIVVNLGEDHSSKPSSRSSHLDFELFEFFVENSERIIRSSRPLMQFKSSLEAMLI